MKNCICTSILLCLLVEVWLVRASPVLMEKQASWLEPGDGDARLMENPMDSQKDEDISTYLDADLGVGNITSCGNASDMSTVTKVTMTTPKANKYVTLEAWFKLQEDIKSGFFDLKIQCGLKKIQKRYNLCKVAIKFGLKCPISQNTNHVKLFYKSPASTGCKGSVVVIDQNSKRIACFNIRF